MGRLSRADLEHLDDLEEGLDNEREEFERKKAFKAEAAQRRRTTKPSRGGKREIRETNNRSWDED